MGKRTNEAVPRKFGPQICAFGWFRGVVFARALCGADQSFETDRQTALGVRSFVRFLCCAVLVSFGSFFLFFGWLYSSTALGGISNLRAYGILSMLPHLGIVNPQPSTLNLVCPRTKFSSKPLILIEICCPGIHFRTLEYRQAPSARILLYSSICHLLLASRVCMYLPRELPAATREPNSNNQPLRLSHRI